MAQTIAEVHPELYHYTTVGGLEGIVKSNQLWATNISYLNDAEEHTGYFDRRFPQLIKRSINGALAEVCKTEVGRKRIDDLGGQKLAIKEVQEFGKHIRKVTLDFNSPHVVSFCAAPIKNPNDGLLSQWRGYGSDGGYAVVFDTKGLQKLLEHEAPSFDYQTLMFGDAEYYDGDGLGGARNLETLENEGLLEKTLQNFFLSGQREVEDPLYKAITQLSCAHKHSGFSEEREVGIIAVPADPSSREEVQSPVNLPPSKPMRFNMKNGTLVPYIALFGLEVGGKRTTLPIKKVIIGPHQSKDSRRKSVDLMLKKYGVDAEVVVSRIPYIGR
jgi:Protein of unknown function (DUF2971)